MERAKSEGFAVVALADHDTTLGLAAAGKRAAELDMACIPCVELSVGRQLEIHLLGYGVDPDAPELAALLDEMRRDFPPSELKPLSMILNSEAAGMAHTWGVFEGETLVSYLLMVQPMGCEVSQLDYFSVLPAYRSTGIGARLLAALPAHEEGAKAILIEAECPEKADDEAMAVRRLGFYARCGAVDTGWTEHLFDAWFRVLVLPAEGETLDAETANKELADCYSRVMGADKWRRYVQLYRPDGTEEKF